MRKLTVTYKDPDTLKPRATNPRTHSKKQIEQLKKSIQEFGFVRLVLLDSGDGIVAGHGSTQAAIELGMSDIPTVRVDHLSPAQIRAYVIADNKLAENAGWDSQLLALELKELSLNFDLTLTGFDIARTPRSLPTRSGFPTEVQSLGRLHRNYHAAGPFR